jgi:hypothetical protein
LLIFGKEYTRGSVNGGGAGPTEQWVENVKREGMRRDEERKRRDRVERTTYGRVR